MIRLSKYFPQDRVVRDAECSCLGGGQTRRGGTLAYADTIHYVRQLAENPRVTALITTDALANAVSERLGVVVMENPRTAFYRLHNVLIGGEMYQRIEAQRGRDVRIHPSALVDDDVQLGDGVMIKAGAIVGRNTIIEADVLIEPGVRIGVDGILFFRDELGIRRIAHAGGVKVAAGATLLANSVVVRSIHDSQFTEIGERSIIGVASCIGHEASVGADCIVSGNCVVARNAVLEQNVYIGTNVYVRENCRIGQSARVMAGSIVVTSISAGATVSGNFAIAHDVRLKEFAMQRAEKDN